MNVFLLLSSYYILKTVREALILAHGGAEVKAYAAAGQATLLLLVIPVYSWIANRLTRFRLVATVMLFFVSNLPVFMYWTAWLSPSVSRSICGWVCST
jgi:ATP:ADP antiporter, AAA family